jgi:hypothetical protein
MSQSTDERIREVTARFEAEAKEAEQRARQRLTAQDQPDRGYDHWPRERREQEAQKAQERALHATQQQQLSAAQIEAQNDRFVRSFANLVKPYEKRIAELERHLIPDPTARSVRSCTMCSSM